MIGYAAREITRELKQILLEVCVYSRDQGLVSNPSQLALDCKLSNVINFKRTFSCAKIIIGAEAAVTLA